MATVNEILDEQMAHVRTVVAFAQKAGFFLWLSTLEGTRPNERGGTENVWARWPAGATVDTLRFARDVVSTWGEQNNKRLIEVAVHANPREPGTPLEGVLLSVSLSIPDRVSMRALNAPLHVIAGDVETSKRDALFTGRLITAKKVGDRIDYRSKSAEGAKAIWRVLLSPDVQRMLHQKNHYSRARRAGED